jgi:hypothetical protein
MKSLKDLEEQANELLQFGDSKEKAQGKGMMKVLEALDGFKNPDLVPAKVNELIENFVETQGDYEACREILQDVQQEGWTFDYGLDGIPYHLRKMPIIYIKKSKFLHWYFKEGSDDECKEEQDRMGLLLVDCIIKNGSFTLTAEQILETTNYELIPTRICEGIQLFEFLDYNHKIVLR